MFFLEYGAVNLIRHTDAGQKVSMFRAVSGDTMAEPALFSEAYHCDAGAEDNSSVLYLDKGLVLDVMAQDPSFATSLVQRLAMQVQTYRRRLELLAIRSAEDRVIAGLADGRLTGSVMNFAADLGLSHEAVYRALSKLVRDGRIVRPARGIYEMSEQVNVPRSE
jgi:CRP-like cAMP-binding protein